MHCHFNFVVKNLFTVLLLVPLSLFADSSVLIDGSGRDGVDASDGRGYSTHPGAGYSDGQDGGDASNSSPGEDGRDIIVNLQDLGAQGSVQARVRVFGTVEQRGQFDSRITLHEGSRIEIDASGGDGGDGGRGGDGQGGCNGSRGRDATRYSRGGDGGPGCDGGDAGAGSAGSDGGDAGNVQVHIPVEDIHLALLIDCEALGGQGGGAGAHGQRGSGGRGGAGGSSTSWREQSGQTCTSHQVSNGNGSYSTSRTCTPNYVTKSQPGGSRGRSGSSGAAAHGDVSAGSAGRDGACVFISEEGRRVFRGTKPFEVGIESYTLEDENGDGIFEPLEKITIKNIRVQNRGNLPSPSGKAEFQVFLPNTRYTTSLNGRFDLPRIDPQGRYNVSEELSFYINDTNLVGQNERLVLQDSVSPTSYVTQVEREQPRFQNFKNIVITYPIEISVFSLQKSAGPGQEIPIFWKIKNNSSLDFGGSESLARAIRTSLTRTGGDADSNLFSFTNVEDGQGNLLSDDYLKEILSLRAGQEIILEGRIKISDEALAYTGIDLATHLYFENIRGEEREIQQNLLSLRVSQLYNYNPASEFLLITNSQIERQEFLSWRALAENLGTSMDVWDVDYYGGLSLTQTLSDLDDQSLQDVLGHKTILLLNKTGLDLERSSLDMYELAEVLSERQTNFLVFGGSEDSLESFALKLLSVESSRHEKQGQVLEERFYLWNKPDREAFQEAVEAEAQRLLEEDPDSRYFLYAHYSPNLVESGRLSSSYNLGTLAYSQTLTPGGGRAAFLPLSSSEMGSQRILRSEEVARAAILPTSFQFKIESLSHEELSSEIKNYYADSILYDLFLELDLDEMSYDYTRSLESAGLKLTLYLDQISQRALAEEDYKILAAYKLYLEEIKFRSLRRKISQQASEHFRNESVVSLESEFRKEARDRRRLLTGISKRDNYRNMFTYPAVFRAITTDSLLRNGNLRQGGE